MKVRTIKRHGNAYKPQYVKNLGRKYVATDSDAKNLITAGLVEEDKPDAPDGQD